MRTKLAATIAGCLLCLGLAQPLAAEQEPSSIVRFDDDVTGLSVLRAELRLPTPGIWMLRPGMRPSGPSLSELFLTPTDQARQILSGNRTGQREEQEGIQRGSQPLTMLYWLLLQFERSHDGRHPRSFEELGEEAPALLELDGNYHILFEGPIGPEARSAPRQDARVIAFEIRPYVDDGKHWVLLSNGQTDRRAVDPKLIEKHGATMVRGRTPWAKLKERGAGWADYLVYARIRDNQPATFEVENALSGRTLGVRVDPTGSPQGTRGILGAWATLRMAHLPLYGQATDAAVLPRWLERAPALYGARERELDPWNNARGRQQGPSSDIFGVLGGRAAIRETLQTRVIQPGRAQGKGPSVPIANLPGVEIESHPFDEMLGDQAGGRIELADVIPADRLFAYFPKPQGLVEMLDGGGEFLFQAGSIATQRSLEHGLAERYLAALGVDGDWARRLLASGAIQEVALAVPDLFFIDGTEITVVARLRSPLLADTLLRVLGIENLEEGTTLRGPGGETSHWARRDDLLIMSSDAGEIGEVLALHAAGGEGSLGRTAELRYMLTRLPLSESTQAFVYFSDPFIRRLVGPETKIAQYRRLHARSEMEALVAGSLLRRYDGHEDPVDAATLIAGKYAPAPRVATDARLDATYGAVSERFGPLPRMHSLLDLAIEDASPEEAAAYARYLETYNRFWRRYFDPIALRIDQPEPGVYELSVFILPLIENSLYDVLRTFLVGSDDDAPLWLPEIEPQPVACLSLNLSEEAWVEAGGEFGGDMVQQLGLDPAIWDLLGPDIHVAIADSDPVLEMGSGDLTQVLGPFVDSDMIMIPAFVAMLTRPTALCVGVSDPETVARTLDNAVGRRTALMGSRWAEGRLYKVAAREGWVYRIAFFGLIKLRLGIEIQDRYLVIRNLPLTTSFQVVGRTKAGQAGARIVIAPEACDRQLPSLFASAAEYERDAALDGISHLHPVLLTTASSIQEAADLHASWFGFRPVHPVGGRWVWDGRELTSDRYGSLTRPTQPDYRTGDRAFGLLRRVDRVEANMRFEEDGLRAVVRWTLRPSSAR